MARGRRKVEKAYKIIEDDMVNQPNNWIEEKPLGQGERGIRVGVGEKTFRPNSSTANHLAVQFMMAMSEYNETVQQEEILALVVKH